ncbi:hypothetical protein [Streptomyces sp. PU-14G]|uniref:hypothetical protein n=1 Tax=Streptomyces sp. PU-14G TaxID=2800808 RepID=UPI0034DE8057
MARSGKGSGHGRWAPTDDLLHLVDAFLGGRDQSLQLINKIERILIDHFPDSDVFEELTEPLTLFRPGCGTPYYDVPEMEEVLRSARDGIAALR